MATITQFDETNKLETRSIPYEQYFGEMDLDTETKETLIEHAEILEEVMRFWLALVIVGGIDEYNKQSLKYELADRYRSEISNFMEVDNKVSRYIDWFAEKIVETTYKNKANSWVTSEDRAKFVAENESLTLYNYTSYQMAIAKGYKRKQWIAILDNHTRRTHSEVAGQIIPIEDFFIVGDSFLLYPKDLENGIDNPEEIINCRCKVKYLR